MTTPRLASPDGDDHKDDKDNENDQIDRHFSSGEFFLCHGPARSGVFAF